MGKRIRSRRIIRGGGPKGSRTKPSSKSSTPAARKIIEKAEKIRKKEKQNKQYNQRIEKHLKVTRGTLRSLPQNVINIINSANEAFLQEIETVATSSQVGQNMVVASGLNRAPPLDLKIGDFGPFRTVISTM